MPDTTHCSISVRAKPATATSASPVCPAIAQNENASRTPAASIAYPAANSVPTAISPIRIGRFLRSCASVSAIAPSIACIKRDAHRLAVADVVVGQRLKLVGGSMVKVERSRRSHLERIAALRTLAHVQFDRAPHHVFFGLG